MDRQHEVSACCRIEVLIVAPVPEKAHDFLSASLFGPILEPVYEATKGKFFLAVVTVVREDVVFKEILADCLGNAPLKQILKFLVLKRVANLDLVQSPEDVLDCEFDKR